jgi:P27 family predicted phage terminase small subunit
MTLPTKLKELKGTKRNCRTNPDEPQYPTAIPTPPDYLDDDAIIEWERVTPLLYSQGLISELDMAMLAGYCTSYSTWVKAERDVQKYGLTRETSTGSLVQTPYLNIANSTKKLMKDFAVQFGMSPVSKARVSARKPNTKVDPWAKFGKTATG